MLFSSVGLENFKSHKSLMVKLNEKETVVQGPNGIGKTTVGEAVIWCLTGKDIYGDPAHKRLINVDADKMSVTIESPGRFVLERSVTRKSNPTIKLQVNGWPKPVTLSQAELEEKLGVDFVRFSAIFNVGWFLSHDPKGRRDILRSFLGNDSLRDTVATLLGHEPPAVAGVTYTNLKKDLAVVTSLRLNAQKEAAAVEAALGEQRSILASLSDADVNRAELEKVYSNLLAEQSAINSYLDKKRIYDHAVTTRRDEVRRFQEAQVRMQELSKEAEILKNTPEVPPATLEALALHEKKMPADTRMPMPAKPVFGALPDGVCTSCGQKITEKTKLAFEERLKTAMAKWEADNAKVVQHNLAFENQMRAWQSHKEELEKAIQKSKERYRGAMESLSVLRAEYKTLSSLKEPMLPEQPSTALDVSRKDFIEAEVRKIGGQMAAAEQMGAKIGASRARISELEKTAAGVARKVDGLVSLEEALKRVPSVELKRIKDAIGIEGYSLEMVEKDGEAVGIEYYNQRGVPYSYMSTGEKMKLSCLVSGAISKWYSRPDGSPRLPFFFIDNHELMDETDTMRSLKGQIIVTRVSRDVDRLNILS